MYKRHRFLTVHAAVYTLFNLNRALIFLFISIGATSTDTALADDSWGSLQLLGREIGPGTRSKFSFMPDASFEASYLNMPVFASRGLLPGRTLCITAGLHGDELNGVEIARRAFALIDPQEMHGTLIVRPAINAGGVRAGNRYLSDRRDLNRAFPGREGGSIASFIAYEVFTKVLTKCDAVVDLHTASNQRVNLPQIRADLSEAGTKELAIHFGLGIIVGETGPDGSLRSEAVKTGIPAIIYEAGEPFRFQEDEIRRGVKGIENVMAYLDMTPKREQEIPESRIYERSTWVRAAPRNGGFFFPIAKLGDIVRAGDSLGNIIDPYGDASFDVISPRGGEIVGMALPQPVLPGYALFHLAWHSRD